VPNVTTYDYRADGMRVRKSNMQTTTLYRYDGQMGVGDVEFSTGATTITKVTCYGVGARGIAVVSQTTGDESGLRGAVGIGAPMLNDHALFNVALERFFALQWDLAMPEIIIGVVVAMMFVATDRLFRDSPKRVYFVSLLACAGVVIASIFLYISAFR